MSMNDLLSDFIARVRNGQRALLPEVRCQYSKLLEAVSQVLMQEGYINAHRVEEASTGRKELVVELKYHEGAAVVQEIKRVSTPGRRVYRNIGSLPRIHNGLGIAIISTSKGVMSDFDARQANVGGEVLCSVF